MGSVMFGELVEPTTRAFIEDEEYTEYEEKQSLDFLGQLQVPQSIDILVFIETENVKNLVLSCVLENKNSSCELENLGLEVYHMQGDKYIVYWSHRSKFLAGEITILFKDWLKLAKNIYAVTSSSIGNYQNTSLDVKPASLLRYLSNDDDMKYSCGRLEPPNLITGLGAGILSLCIHLGIKCTLFITYIDLLPLDSVNTGPLREVFRRIKLPMNDCNLKNSTTTSNLYM